MLIITSLSAVISLYAQERFTVSYRNAKLETVLKDLNRKMGLSFVCDRRCLQYTSPITLHATNVTLDELLPIVFAEQPVDYFHIANRMAIVPKDVKGKVTDASGKPLAGVVVRADWQIMQTDSTGEFILRKAACVQSIHFSNARDSLAMPVKGRISFNVIMKSADSPTAPPG